MNDNVINSADRFANRAKAAAAPTSVIEPVAAKPAPVQPPSTKEMTEEQKMIVRQYDYFRLKIKFEAKALEAYMAAVREADPDNQLHVAVVETVALHSNYSVETLPDGSSTVTPVGTPDVYNVEGVPPHMWSAPTREGAPRTVTFKIGHRAVRTYGDSILSTDPNDGTGASLIFDCRSGAGSYGITLPVQCISLMFYRGPDRVDRIVPRDMLEEYARSQSGLNQSRRKAEEAGLTLV